MAFSPNYYLQYILGKGAVCLLESLPFSVSCAVVRGLGNLFFWMTPGRRKIARENIDRVYADSLTASRKKDILKKSFESAALSILELFLIKKIKRHVDRHFVVTGAEHLHEALARGKGAVLVTSHLGSWEYLAFLFYLTKTAGSVIVKKIKNPQIDALITELRKETTLTPIPKKKAIREALSKLKKNQVVAILIDQWDGPEGLWVDFMGTFASTTSLPSRLAEKTGCALVPAYCLRSGVGRYEIQVLAPIFYEGGQNWETSATNKLNQGLERHIRQYPEQWLWAHRRWKDRPSISRQIV